MGPDASDLFSFPRWGLKIQCHVRLRRVRLVLLRVVTDHPYASMTAVHSFYALHYPLRVHLRDECSTNTVKRRCGVLSAQERACCVERQRVWPSDRPLHLTAHPTDQTKEASKARGSSDRPWTLLLVCALAHNSAQPPPCGPGVVPSSIHPSSTGRSLIFQLDLSCIFISLSPRLASRPASITLSRRQRCLCPLLSLSLQPQGYQPTKARPNSRWINTQIPELNPPSLPFTLSLFVSISRTTRPSVTLHI